MGEMAKRALKWPKHFSNTAALVTLDLPTSRCHIFQRKLNFLRRLMTPEALESNRIGSATTKTFADDIEDLCLVKECRELDSVFNSDFTTKVLTDGCNQREMKNIIQSLDKEATLEKCTSKAPPIAQVVIKGGSWSRLWDCASHLGSRHLRGLQNLTRLMAHHGRGTKPCPLCDDSTQPLIDHVLTCHHNDLGLGCISEAPLSCDELLNHLVNLDICFVYKLWTLYSNYF